MIEELTMEWIVYHYYANTEGDFWVSIKTTKRLLYRSPPCNNSSSGSSGNKGERVSE